MITRESDYAVRMIRALKDGEQLTIEQICRKEQVPRQFAYKILKKLEKAGLVRIRRGAGGGCSLGRGLDVLTLLDVIRATDEEFFLNPCLKQGYRCEYAAAIIAWSTVNWPGYRQSWSGNCGTRRWQSCFADREIHIPLFFN